MEPFVCVDCSAVFFSGHIYGKLVAYVILLAHAHCDQKRERLLAILQLQSNTYKAVGTEA